MFLLRVAENTRSRIFVRIDTSDILFICGGTFNGLDKIISNRLGSKVIGFEADIKRAGGYKDQ